MIEKAIATKTFFFVSVKVKREIKNPEYIL